MKKRSQRHYENNRVTCVHEVPIAMNILANTPRKKPKIFLLRIAVNSFLASSVVICLMSFCELNLTFLVTGFAVSLSSGVSLDFSA